MYQKCVSCGYRFSNYDIRYHSSVVGSTPSMVLCKQCYDMEEVLIADTNENSKLLEIYHQNIKKGG